MANKALGRARRGWPSEISAAVPSFKLSLQAENKAPRTIQSYLEGIGQFVRHLDTQGMPTEVVDLRREHVESFISALLERFKPATAANRFRSIQAFFKWVQEEGEITSSPVANMAPPRVPETPIPALRKEVAQ
jgi:site-specific recombinase XerD